MSELTQCAACGNRVHRPKTGRPPRYCTVLCKRAGRNARERNGRHFGYIKRHWLDQGEDTVRVRLAGDPVFAEQAIDTVEHYLREPVGRPQVHPEAEVIDLLRGSERRFSVISHDTPLPSSADIDAAEASGDWSAMARAALNDMAWQRANGFEPDLRGLGLGV